MTNYVYIDGANLHQGSKSRWGIDYQKFKTWIGDKYRVSKIYLFMWYIKGNELLYSQLSQWGYILIFKETLKVDGKVKWNCDAELVIKAVSDQYEQPASQVILITGDGDFACLLDFFRQKSQLVTLLAPNKNYCSYLLKKRNIPIVFLEELHHKLARVTTKI